MEQFHDYGSRGHRRATRRLDVAKPTFAEAGVEAEIEVYSDAQHGWCVTDMPAQGGAPIYSEADAERAWGKLIELYAAALS